MDEQRVLQIGEQLAGGDPSAAEELYRAYGPYLRMVVRRRMTPRLRSRFDSHDVVQSVWADTLIRAGANGSRRQFRDEPGLKAFLVRLTLNRFIDFYRRHRRSLARETRLSDHDERAVQAPRGDRPSEQARADELWARLLSACPLAHRDVLRLKTRGDSLAEISLQTGLHASSIRRILHDLAGRLDFEDR